MDLIKTLDVYRDKAGKAMGLKTCHGLLLCHYLSMPEEKLAKKLFFSKKPRKAVRTDVRTYGRTDILYKYNDPNLPDLKVPHGYMGSITIL